MAKSDSGKGLNYAASGVDIAAGEQAVERIKSLARKTFNENVLSEIGSFGGFFRPDLTGLKEPVLISSADGVGTKLKLAFMTGKHTTVGEDLVNHCVNDILVHGARPLFFLDYIGTGKLKPEVVADIVEGFSRGCANVGMALIGGEVAEMPGFYQAGEYDLAGFIVGILDKDRIINGSTIREGDVCIGLASNGLHTNGYTLARKIAFEIDGLSLGQIVPELNESIDSALMRVHHCYAGVILPLLKKHEVVGMAHITGGGIAGNLRRIIPAGLSARIKKGTWPVLPIFNYLQRAGGVSEDDMFEAFNMGVGYILVVRQEHESEVMASLSESGVAAYRIGEIVRGEQGVVLD